MRFQWALKCPNERERKNGIASSIRDTRTPLSDTFNNFNPWFNHERQDDLPSYKGLMWLLATLLRPTFFFPLLFSRSQIRTINSHGDGIQLKEAIPTSPLSGLSLESCLSFSLSLRSFHILRVSRARPEIIEHVSSRGGSKRSPLRE